MYQIPFDGYRMNALLQYSLINYHKGEPGAVLGPLMGKTTVGKTFEGSGTNIPTTLEEMSEVTAINSKDIALHLLNSMVEMTDAGLNYKTIFTKSALIPYIMNEQRDLNDIQNRAISSFLEEYRAASKNTEELPDVIGTSAEFNMIGWVLNNIYTTCDNGNSKRNKIKPSQSFKAALRQREEEMGSISTVVDARKKDPIGPFAKLIYTADKVDRLCTGVVSNNNLCILYRFIDVMAMRENLDAKGIFVDYDDFKVESVERGSSAYDSNEDTNAKLYQYQVISIPMPNMGDTYRFGEVQFDYDCDLIHAEGEQDKNLKKLYYKILVDKIVGHTYPSILRLLVTANSFYSDIVYNYRLATNSSNSVTLLTNGHRTLYVDFNEEGKAIPVRTGTGAAAPQLNREVPTELQDIMPSVWRDISNTVFRIYSKTSGDSFGILSDRDILDLMPIADLASVVQEVTPLMHDHGISWRALRKLYKEYSNRGQILTFNNTTINKLYTQLQFVKQSKEMFDIHYQEDQPTLDAVFPKEQLLRLEYLLKTLRNPLHDDTQVVVKNYKSLLGIKTPEEIATAEEEIYDELVELIQNQHNSAIGGIISALNDNLKYLYACIFGYGEEVDRTSDLNGRYATLFALLFDDKVVEVNQDIESLRKSFKTSFVKSTRIINFIISLFDGLFGREDYTIPFCLQKSKIFISESELDEDKINDILEKVLKQNPVYIQNLLLLSSINGEVNKPGCLIGADKHYRNANTKRLLIQPLGGNVWGILNAVTNPTRAKQMEDGSWEIENLY